MKIAHVVTLASASGAFGGPLTVAMQQADELASRGHEVAIFAGWDGVEGRQSDNDVQMRLHRAFSLIPRAGFSGLVAPKFLAEFTRAAGDFDVVHTHLCRDLITTSGAWIALRKRKPLITQTHGMVDVDLRLKSRLMDGLLMRRLLSGAATALALTDHEERALAGVAPKASVQRLPNGIKVVRDAPRKFETRPRILFCARLHPRKRVMAYVDMARILLQRGVDAEFIIAGPDGGDLGQLLGALTSSDIRGRVRYLGALDAASARQLLSESTVFVLPSVDEPFPMTVLEALAEGTPTVVTDSCHIGPDLAKVGAVRVAMRDPESLATEVERLLLDQGQWNAASSAGIRAVRDEYSIVGVVDRLESVYKAAASDPTQSGRGS